MGNEMLPIMSSPLPIFDESQYCPQKIAFFIFGDGSIRLVDSTTLQEVGRTEPWKTRGAEK